MKTRLLNLRETVRISFWYIPSVMIFLAIGLSFTIVALDRLIEPERLLVLEFLYSGGAEEARTILSTIAGSMITVAGVTFSITIVALALTSSQFGPRLLRNFMQDTGTQFVLGTFISTFIYCLLVLMSIHSIDGTVFVPSIAVTFAIFLAVINAGVLVFFIHHVSTMIQADGVVAEVFDELSEHIEKFFPEELGCESMQDEKNTDREKSTIDRYTLTCEITASGGGYLRFIDNDSLLKITEEHDFFVHIMFRPGEFIVEGSSLAVLKSSKPVEEDLTKQILHCFNVGSKRSPEQDIEFAIHQLVEIALRALSPSINDPFTAISCIDRLGAALCDLANRAFPLPYHYGAEGRLRIIAKPPTFERVVNAAFNQIRQDGSTNVAVSIRLLDSLKIIAGRVRNSEQRQAIRRQADMIARTSQYSIKEKDDKEDIQQHYQEFLIVLNG